MKPHESNAQNQRKINPNPSCSSSQLPYDQFHMTQATTRILENVGFTAANQSCIHSLSSMMKNYFEELCRSSRLCANQAGREGVLFEDVNVAFKKVGVNITELHDYIREVDSFTTNIKVPLFPVAKSPVYTSEFVELAVEPQRNGVGPENEATAEATSAIANPDNKALEESSGESQPQQAESFDRPPSSAKREVRPQRAFPSFFGFKARDLGFLVKTTPQTQVPAGREERHKLIESQPSTSSPIKNGKESISKSACSSEKEDTAEVKSPGKPEISALQAIFANYSKEEESSESKSKKKKKKRDKDESRRQKKKEKRDKKLKKDSDLVPQQPPQPVQTSAVPESIPDETVSETATVPQDPVQSEQPLDLAEPVQKIGEENAAKSDMHEPDAAPDKLVEETTEIAELETEKEEAPLQKDANHEDEEDHPPPPTPILPVLTPEVRWSLSPQAIPSTPDTVEDNSTSHHKKKKSKKDKRERDNNDRDNRKEKKTKKRSRHKDEEQNGRKESKRAKPEEVADAEEQKVPKITIKFGLNKSPLTSHLSAQSTSGDTASSILTRSSPPATPTNKASTSVPGFPPLLPPISINSTAVTHEAEQQQPCSSSARLPSTSQPPPPTPVPQPGNKNEERPVRQSSPPDMACATTSVPIVKALKIVRKEHVNKEDKPTDKKKPGPKKGVICNDSEVALLSPKLKKTTTTKRSETPNQASSSFNLSQEVRRSESAMERPNHQVSRSHTPPPVVLLPDEKKVVKREEPPKKLERPKAKAAGVPPSLPAKRLKLSAESKTAPRFEDIFGKDVKKTKLEQSKTDKSAPRPASALAAVNPALPKPTADTNKPIQSTPKQGTGRKQSKPKKLSPAHVSQEVPSTPAKITTMAKKKKHLDTEINRILNTNTKKQTPTSKPTASQPVAVKEVVETKEETDNVWICPVCSVAYVDGASDMVGCDGCNDWFHWHCVGLLIAPPENKEWYCPNCSKKRKKLGESAAPKKKSSTTAGTKPPLKKK